MNPGNMVLTATVIIPYPVNVLWMTMYILAESEKKPIADCLSITL